jgi:DHA1 family multidrug resistance protein-like MFS transporter
MRASQDTDRTQVDTQVNSGEHLDALSEKKTNMSAPELAQSESTRQRFYDNDDDLEGGAFPETDSTDEEKDLERGDEEGDNAKAEAQKKKEEKDLNLIEWDGPNDPENPMNWKTSKKWTITVMLGLMTFCVTFASSVFSTATKPVAKLYGVSTEVATLGTSLFVLGFSVGPLVCIFASYYSGQSNNPFLGLGSWIRNLWP